MHARSQDLDFRTSIFGSQDLDFRTSIFGSQDLGFRTSMRGFKTWISGPGFQALNARFQDLTLRTWVSGPQYLALRTWVSGPRKLSILRSSYLFSASNGHRQLERRTGLCILIHRQDRFCHRKCPHGRLDSTGELKRRTIVSDGRTDVVNLYIRLVMNYIN
jgi:hypothetical protein